jgi:Family of unknown function (DUF6308)
VAIARDELMSIVDDLRSVDDLREYFGVGAPPGTAPPFTGGRFDQLAGGGDRTGFEHLITPDDLIAVELLSVHVPKHVALELLEGPLGEDVAAELRALDTDVDLGSAAAANLLADGGPADLAWRLLKAPDGMGWVTAGKLLARKRPRLIPVYDGVVRCALGRPPNAWLWLNDSFSEGQRELARRLVDIRQRTGVPDAVPPPRVLDVVLWMRHRRSHRSSRCRRLEFAP